MSGPRCRAIRSSPVARALRRRRARYARGSAAAPISGHNASQRIRDCFFSIPLSNRYPASCRAAVSHGIAAPDATRSVRARPGRPREQSIYAGRVDLLLPRARNGMSPARLRPGAASRRQGRACKPERYNRHIAVHCLKISRQGLRLAQRPVADPSPTACQCDPRSPSRS